VVAVLAAAVWAIDWLAFRFTHSISKDAFIESHLINVSPQVAGDIVDVYVGDGDPAWAAEANRRLAEIEGVQGRKP